MERTFEKLLISGLAMSPDLAKLEFPQLVRLLRGRLGITQEVLAKRAGMPQSYVGKLESGKVSPSLKMMERIFSALSCELVLVPRPQGMQQCSQSLELDAHGPRGYC